MVHKDYFLDRCQISLNFLNFFLKSARIKSRAARSLMHAKHQLGVALRLGEISLKFQETE